MCLVTKPKVASAPAPAAAPAVSAVAPTPAPAPVPQPPAAVVSPPVAPADAEPVGGTAESTLLTGPAYDLTVQNIVSMGYPESQV